jgi:hypothetical protein
MHLWIELNCSTPLNHISNYNVLVGQANQSFTFWLNFLAQVDDGLHGKAIVGMIFVGNEMLIVVLFTV